MLKSLGPPTTDDFPGGPTPAPRLEGLGQPRQDARVLVKDLPTAFLRMPPDERPSYVGRVKIYGKVAAMKRLQGRTATPGETR